MLPTPARLGRRQASSPRSGPSRSRIPSSMRLSARNPSTAPTVPSRSNKSKTSRTTLRTCSSGIQHHLTGGTARQPGRQRHRQLAAAGLGDPPGPHPLLDQVQLSLADGALQAQQQPVVVPGRVIDAVQVAQQRPGQRAQLQQLMPLPAGPGQQAVNSYNGRIPAARFAYVCSLACSFQGASQTAYIGVSSRGDPPAVLGIDGLLAVVADVRRLREVRAGADEGGERCLEMLLCPLEPAGAGDRAGMGVVPGGRPGARGSSAGPAGRADGARDGRERG